MPAFLGIQEIVLLSVVVLIVFGAKRLPEIGRSLGRGMREFKDGVTGQTEPGGERQGRELEGGSAARSSR